MKHKFANNLPQLQNKTIYINHSQNHRELNKEERNQEKKKTNKQREL
jgi:hypothetical protein